MKKFMISLGLAVILISGCLKKSDLKITSLTCNGFPFPVGTEDAPLFRWQTEAIRNNASFTKWEIRLINSDTVNYYRGKNENEWRYDGQPLLPARLYKWQIRVKSKGRGYTEWSDTASFISGLPDNEWSDAKWIALEELPDSLKIIPAVHGDGNDLGPRGVRRPVIPLFRREFIVRKNVSSAVLYICGLGQYKLTIDGQSPDERFLAPGWTWYSKTCLYNGYDLTGKLMEGQHTLGIIAGNGFYNVNRERYRKLVSAWGMPVIRMKMFVNYMDGTTETLVSDEQWKVSGSPVTFTSIYGGEDYDARLEKDGWNAPGYDDSGWKNALVTNGPGGIMKCEEDFPVRIMQTFEPVKITPEPDGTFLYDFGQNASGIPEITVNGAPGQQVRLTPGEVLDDKGFISQAGSGGPCYYTYTCAGKADERWEPEFSYYGFRYLSLSGGVPADSPDHSGKPVVNKILFHHIRNSSPSAGTFRCSNELFNKIYSLIDWGIRSNMVSVATDCPHREKLGWLEQVNLMGPSIQYMYDIHKLYSRIVHDMMDSQLPNGLVPDIAPEYVPFIEGFRDSPEWGSSAIILPFYLYKWYGDSKIVEDAWPMMTRYADYLYSRSDSGIVSHGLGDWCDLGPDNPGYAQLTPVALTATATYYYDLTLMSKIAGILGKQNDAMKYINLSGDVRRAFLKKFYNPAGQTIATGSQTSLAMPLATGLIPPEMKTKVEQSLIKAVERDGYALTAGDIGFHYLVKALHDAGADDVIWRMNCRNDVPGYGFQIAKGATSLTESWQALKFVSNNHMMLGHLMEWLYNGIGGISQVENSVAYDSILIDPKPVGDLTWAEVTHNCVKGLISVRWEKVNSMYSLDVTIPVNCRAKVRFNGKYIGNFGSGSYKFSVN